MKNMDSSGKIFLTIFALMIGSIVAAKQSSNEDHNHSRPPHIVAIAINHLEYSISKLPIRQNARFKKNRIK